MVDAFELLSEQRRPWLDEAALKGRFIEQSSPFHPDRVHGAPEADRLAATERYAELNAAFNRLREPRDRLLHLLELESGSSPGDIQRIPPGTMDLFVEIGQTCRDCDAFLAGRGTPTSPMLKLKAMRESLDWSGRIDSLRDRVMAKRDSLAGELEAMNPLWAAAPPVGDSQRRAALPLERLEQIYRAMSYIARWTGQLDERRVQLAM
jgi:hypothetical protein